MASRGSRWDPFREIAQLQSELGRLAGSVGGEREGGRELIAPVDIWETDDDLVYALDLPGVPRDAISIELEDNTITISAEREPPAGALERMHRRERRYGTFTRTIAVPPGTAEDAISASSDLGVLEIHVRKPQEAKPRRITISPGG